MAIARALGEDGYAVTVSARRPDKLRAAVDELAAEGLEVTAAPADVSDEEQVVKLFADHKERYGRLDVLVNNAGLGIGGPLAEIETKKLDMQLNVNLRSYVIAIREAAPMLTATGGEHRKALIVNTASIAGKAGQGWLAVYSATKAGVIGLTQAAQTELASEGIQCTALCPGFVDTPMTEWIRGQVDPKDMIKPEDLAETVRLLLRTSPNCLIPEIVYTRPGDASALSV
jgi:NAD(P)-dependent dehydrogenase (short-subunit alcohol dehydrogenase family)